MNKLLSMVLAGVMGSGLCIGPVHGSDYDKSNGSAENWLVREDACSCTDATIVLFNYPNYVIIVGAGNYVKNGFNGFNMVNGFWIPLQIHGMSAADAEDIAHKVEQTAEFCNLLTQREMVCDSNIDIIMSDVTRENYEFLMCKLAQLLQKTVIVIFGDVAVHIDCPTTIETCPGCGCYGVSIDNNYDAMINVDLLNGDTYYYCYMFYSIPMESKLPEIRTGEVRLNMPKLAVYYKRADVTYIPVYS